MTSSNHSRIILFIAVFLIGTLTFGQKNKIALINSYLDKTHQSGLFNGNILIADHGKVMVKKAIGYADASKKIPLTTQYRFHIGSIAKEFDAVGLMMLQEQGKLNINDKVSQFFPDLPSWATSISIKNLLQYTSGLPDIKWQTVHSDADHWKDLQSLQKLDFEPGSSYAYNNNNVFLRRRIIEKVTGMPFNEFVLQKILKKAGITNGLVDPTDKDPFMARSFDNNFKQDGLEVPISGWTSLNLEDFYKWAHCIDTFCLINPSSTREIMMPVGQDKQSGLGNGSMDGDKVITHVHDGSAIHYQALVQTDTGKGRTIIILSNQKQGNVYEIAEAIEAILDEK
ncbi:serine hydrolase domain-containing protein [Chryseobacterium sp. T16E-39]|uniref:serine hydrolase domain-containing protein n=1 Tax=Chryseobacterium sp. T16E-39 TaxID=2015076 RepID=UPI0012FA0A98|nr:serine hydrolase domain-containing protein [Chryseobacterium sp. T16E-39]